MVTVKMLKPYYIKTDQNFVRVILAYQYFAIFINQKVYQFVPIEAKEIRINRRTKKIANMDAKFAFQKGKDIIHIPMTELISLPDFLMQIHSIAKPYYVHDISENEPEQHFENAEMMEKLEKENIKRLIDNALDLRDEAAFYKLVKLL